MGTRGLYGFRKNDIDKTTYNHWDSYPQGLGREVVKFCQKYSIEELNSFYDKLILVQEADDPTEEEMQECAPYCDESVGTRADGWYRLLRKLQGNLMVLGEILSTKENFYMIDNHSFIEDSLFCEYAYIINLDTNMLEVFVGFQKTPWVNNRYGTEESQGYYPCKRVMQIPLDSIANKSVEEITTEMDRATGSENDEEPIPF